jgi:hypothetical protein
MSTRLLDAVAVGGAAIEEADNAAVDAAERAAPEVKRPSRLWVKVSHALLMATYLGVVVLAGTYVIMCAPRSEQSIPGTAGRGVTLPTATAARCSPLARPHRVRPGSLQRWSFGSSSRATASDTWSRGRWPPFSWASRSRCGVTLKDTFTLPPPVLSPEWAGGAPEEEPAANGAAGAKMGASPLPTAATGAAGREAAAGGGAATAATAEAPVEAALRAAAASAT